MLSGGSTGALHHPSLSPQPVHRYRTGLAVVSFFNILYGTFAGITRFDTKEVEYRSADIPEGFDGYRIVQISDIHIGSWQGNPDPIKQLVDSVNGQKPDLIVFTGDLVNQQSHELDGFQEILSQLYAPDEYTPSSATMTMAHTITGKARKQKSPIWTI